VADPAKNGGITEAAHLLPLFANESQELNIHLDVMPRNLFLVALGVYFTHTGTARKAVHPVAAEDA